MKWRSEECSAGRSLPESMMVLLVAETFTRLDMEGSARAASIWPLYFAAAAVMGGSAFFGSGLAAGGSDFFSTAVAGVWNGAGFPGAVQGAGNGPGTAV